MNDGDDDGLNCKRRDGVTDGKEEEEARLPCSVSSGFVVTVGFPGRRKGDWGKAVTHHVRGVPH